MDYYQVLGVDRTADEQAIKRAYRKLAMKHHPDRGGDPDQFAKVQEAYDALSNPQSKAEYDNPQTQWDYSTHSMNDIFDSIFGSNGQHPFQDRNFHRVQKIQIPVNFFTAIKGGIEHVAIAGMRQALEIQVPQGVNNGDQVRYPRLLHGKDLIVIYRVLEDNYFRRSNLDIHIDQTVDVFDLITGVDIIVPTIWDTKIKLKIAPGTQPGTVQKIAAMGVQKGLHKGNMYVKIKASIPQSLPEELLNTIKDYQNR